MDQLSLVFSALSDPTRRAMLARLSQGEANVGELAKPFLKSMSLPAVTKHLKVLENAGLISKTADAQFRSCRLNSEPLKEANNWIDEFKAMWEESFDRLDEYLKEIQRPEKSKGKKTWQKKMRFH